MYLLFNSITKEVVGFIGLAPMGGRQTEPPPPPNFLSSMLARYYIGNHLNLFLYQSKRICVSVCEYYTYA